MRRSRPAFTLIEMVLSISLSMALVMAMLVFYERVTEVRAAVREQTQTISEERTIMDLMTQDLRSAFVYSPLSLGVDGATAGQVRLVTVALPGGISWVVQSVTATEKYPPQPDLAIVGYRLRTTEDDSGQTVVVGVERTSQRTPTLSMAVEGVDIQATLLSSQMKFLRLRYWDGAAWQESWSTGDLPGAVEISLGRQPLPEGVEPAAYPYEVFRRVVCIPAGVKPPSSTVVTGLDDGGAGL